MPITKQGAFIHLYSSGRWKNARKKFMARYPTCVDCGRPGRQVDHKIPHRGNLTLFWDVRNWETRCWSCHSRKTTQQDGGFGNPIKEVLSGCDASGEPNTPGHPWVDDDS